MANVLPGIIANYPDGGLKIQSPAAQGDSILVIGTAEDGPMNEAIEIQSLSDLTDLFGDYMGEGSLVRGVYEVWNATSNPVNVRALRIGNGSPSTLGVKEAGGTIQSEFAGWPAREGSSASGIADASFSVSGSLDFFIDALTLTSKYEGSIYNRFQISEDRDTSGRRAVKVYNPILDESIFFSFDISNQHNSNVDVHNVSELADAINANSSLNPYISASVQDLTALYEIVVSGTGVSNAQVVPASGGTDKDAFAFAGYEGLREGTGSNTAIDTTWNTNGTLKDVTLNLSYITTSTDKDSDGIPDAIRAPLADSGVPNVIKVGPIGLTYDLNIPTAGNQIVLDYVYDIALASGELLDVGGLDAVILANYPVNRNTSQGGVTGDHTIIKLDGSSLTRSEYKEYNTNLYIGTSTDGTTDEFDWDAVLQPSFIHDAYTGHSSDALASGTDIDTYNGLATTVLDVHVYETISGVTSLCVKPYSITWVTGTGTIEFTDSDHLPLQGTILTINYDTVAGDLTETGTLTELETKRTLTNGYTYYFISGNNIMFAGSMPTDIKISYEYKRVYDIPGDVSTIDGVLGGIKFTNPSKMPQLMRSGGTRIGLNYTYLPEWIDITTPATMAGGGNGTNMTKKEQYDALTEAYDALANYSIDIIVPVGAYLDDVKYDYDTETGIRREVNAGFHTQFATFLESLNANIGMTLGIIGVKPAESRSMVGVNTWTAKLITTNSNDPNRAANYMPFFSSRWMSVVASDVLISPKLIGLPSTFPDYYTNASTLYAGLITSLQPQDATTYKYIGRATLGPAYRLSRKQLNDLSIARYVTIQLEEDLGTIITMDVTAAPVGSDYDKLSTTRIVKLVSDVIRRAAKPYIGKPNSHYKINSLTTEINSSLTKLSRSDNNALQAFSFDLASSPQEQRHGIVRVEVDIVPVFCINQIHVTVNLRDML